MLLNNEIIIWNKLNIYQKKKILLRPAISQSINIRHLVLKIIQHVELHGDNALIKYTKKFDNLNVKNFLVDHNRINDSEFLLNKELKNAILHAKNNIQSFHSLQYMKEIDINTQVGVRCKQKILPIQSVGLYVPGGTAPLLSTALMLAIPAKIAKCKNIVLCSPPPIMNEILYIAKICGVHSVFEVGGAQAIAAMGFGTETIPKVNKIFGPGNMYVTEAKIQLNQLIPGLSIDMIAGPSELLIIADDTANPIFLAADVLSQAEHGIDSQIIVLTNSKFILEEILLNINRQLCNSSRLEIMKTALSNSRFVLTSTIEECIDIANQYASEHVIIQTKSPKKIEKDIVNAGSVFLGLWTPESVGDYASGTNHVLPTNFNSTSVSGLSVIDFQKKITVQELTPFGLKKLSSTINMLTKSENMHAHNFAVQVRLGVIKEKYEKLS
ncbi:histidinol dehydrogenase [Buchnera aphidicola]|uniref:histidinol dehydrogenase n=1 Tax=Buchnera aphidicola TaxID=9 RepID=UPI0031B810B0